MSKNYIGWSLLIWLLGISTVKANNGQIAYAYPLVDKKIIIDGDFSDWPKDLPSFAIEQDYFGGSMPDTKDFSAHYKVVYSEVEKAVYFALKITDQSHIVDDKDPEGWSNQDSVTVYIDANHSKRGSGAQLYTAKGSLKMLINSSKGWDPDVAKASWDNADVKVMRVDNTTNYEWRIVLDQNALAGKSIGFDLLISDRDQSDTEEQASIFMWGPFTGKSQSANRIGDLVLLKQGDKLGTLKGSIKDELSTKNDKPLERVKVVNNSEPDLWLHTPIDEQGNYQLELPVGKYTVSSAYVAIGDPWRGGAIVDPISYIEAQVKAAKLTVAPLLTIRQEQAPDLLLARGALFDYDKSKKQEMDRVISAYMEHFKVPGASIALVKDGKLVYHNAVGTKNFYTGEPVTQDTLFEAASITKIVFAFAVNRLAEKGVIDLDKPLYRYLPFEVIAHDKRYEKITARHVLSHQTGFPNWAWQNPDNKLDIKFYPGIKFGYSGEGYEYLGRVISHITGKSLEQVIKEEVQEPMGFTDKTFFSDSPQLQKLASHGHYTNYTTPIGIPSKIGVAYSMYTEAKTFANFMTNLMQGNGLSEQSYINMLEPQVEIPTDPEAGDSPWPQRYSLGFRLTNTPYGLAYGHDGSNGDFTCRFEIYKEHNMGFIIFTNNDTGTAFYKKMQEYLITGKEH